MSKDFFSNILKGVAGSIPTVTGTGQLTALNRAVGAGIKSQYEKQLAAKVEAAGKISALLTQPNIAEKIASTIEDTNALVRTLYSTLDTGLVDKALEENWREKLNNLSESLYNMSEENFKAVEFQRQLKDVLDPVLKTISTSDQDTRNMFERNLRESRELKHWIVPPAREIQSTVAYNDLNDLDDFFEQRNISGPQKRSIQKRYKKLMAWARNAGNVKLSTVGDQLYARVFSDKEGRDFLASLPLNLDFGSPNKPIYMRMNQGLSTAYTPTRVPIEASAAERLVAEGVTPENIRKYASNWFDVFFDIVKKESVVSGSKIVGSRKNIGNLHRSFLAVAPRAAYANINDPLFNRFKTHLDNQGSFERNHITIYGLEKKTKDEQFRLIEKLSISPYTDPSTRSERLINSLKQGGQEYVSADIGLYKGSTLESLQYAEKGLGGFRDPGEFQYFERLLFPKVSRIEQASGRETMFVNNIGVFMGKNLNMTGQLDPRMGRSGVFAAGGANEPIGWSSKMTGGTNKLMLIDVSKTGIYQTGLDGQGVAWHSGKDASIRSLTVPVLNPKSNQRQASPLLNFITSRKSGEAIAFDVRDGDLWYDNINYGRYLGEDSTSSKSVKFDPFQKKVFLTWEALKESDKDVVRIVGGDIREFETWKAFSEFFKGSMQHVSPERFNEMLQKHEFLTKGYVGTEHIALTSSDQLFKAAGAISKGTQQAYAFYSGDKDYLKSIVDASQEATGEWAKNPMSKSMFGTMSLLSQQVRSGTIPANIAGAILSGYYHGVVKRGSKAVPGQLLLGADLDSSDALFKSIIGSLFGDFAPDIMKGIEGGMMPVPVTLFQGAGPGDWGEAMGSIEPRIISNMYQQLRTMGLGVEEAQNIIVELYKDKKGAAQGLINADAMLNSIRSLNGISSMRDLDLPKVDVKDLIGNMDSYELAKSNPKGFILNLGDESTPGGRLLSSVARKVFNTTELLLPGADVLSASEETLIKTPHGAIPVTKKTESLLYDLIKSVTNIAGSTSFDSGKAEESLLRFKKDFEDIGAYSIHKMLSGKLGSAQFHYTSLYDLTSLESSNLSLAEFQRVKDLSRQTRNSAFWMDSRAFLSQLKNYMGVSQDSLLGNRSKNLSDAASKLESFYLSQIVRPEHPAYHKSVVSFAARHPALSIGNVPAVQIYRDVQELQDNSALESFLKTAPGQKYKFRTWQDVAKLGRAGRAKFFRDFARGIGEFTGDGGGRVFFARDLTTIIANGKSTVMDLSIDAAGLGDKDGDQWQIMMLNEKTSGSLMNKIRAKEYQNAMVRYRIKSNLLASESKKALEAYAQRTLGIPRDFAAESIERMTQDIRKEGLGSQSIGPLDNQINRIRRAAGNFLGANITGRELDRVNDILAFTKVIEEHVSIKTKKLSSFEDFSSIFKGHIDQAFKGDFSGFRSFVKDTLFEGSDLQNGIDVEVGDQKFNVSLNSFLSDIEEAINLARQTGESDFASDNAIKKVLGSGDIGAIEQMLTFLRAGNTPTTSALEGFGRSTITSKIENLVQRSTGSIVETFSKNAGKIGFGLGALAIANNLVMGNDYSSRTLEGSYVNSAMFEPRDSSVQIQNQNNSVRNDPNLIGQVYMHKPTNYAIHGNIKDMRTFNSFSQFSYSNGLGHSSLTINDNRRPLTQSYIDRLLGE